MHIDIFAVGKAGNRPEAGLTRDYLARLPGHARLVEVEERRPLPAADRTRREGEKLLAAIPGNAFIVSLEETGHEFDSAGFARRLAAWGELGRPLAFVIGGAGGLDPAVSARAEARLSLSKMTWPHMLVRVMLAEQLYRAWSIAAGHPYHRP